MTNHQIAQQLSEYANHLEIQESNLFRARAFRRAAETVLGLSFSLAEAVRERGKNALLELPGIEESLAYTIEGLILTGEFRTLNPAGGHIDPERLLTTLPGVGPHLARLLHERLGITTLEELETAAHEGRLSEVGVGHKRLRGLVDALAGRFQRARLPDLPDGEPPVELLLAVDREYREQDKAKTLPTITPRRFNPEHQRWLPIYTAQRQGWRFRALYSNTALAHRLEKTHDWVVIHFQQGVHSGQRTVVTETRGDLQGRRVVRGRELECQAYYRQEPVPVGQEPAA
jgi:DNA polymerase (family 10)